MSQAPHGGTEPPQPQPGGWDPDDQRTPPPWPPAPGTAEPTARQSPAGPSAPAEPAAGQRPTGSGRSDEPATEPLAGRSDEPGTEPPTGRFDEPRTEPPSHDPDAPSGGGAADRPAWGGSGFPADAEGTARQPFPPGQPAAAAPAESAQPAAPKRRRTAVIASVVLALVLLLCGGGGLSAYLLLRDTEPTRGAPDPATAVDGFLNAVYSEQDPQQAAALVCAEARKGDRIAKKVDEVKAYGQKYKSPAFRWDKPKVEQEAAERATVSATVDMTTADEKTAEQKLTFTVLKKENGWRVCEVAS